MEVRSASDTVSKYCSIEIRKFLYLIENVMTSKSRFDHALSILLIYYTYHFTLNVYFGL